MSVVTDTTNARSVVLGCLDRRPLRLAVTFLSVISWFVMLQWKAAILVVVAICVHEAGHVLVMRLLRAPTTGFWLIPLVGGVAEMQKDYKCPDEDLAAIALAGPLIGCLPAIPLALLGWAYSAEWFTAAAAWIAVVNLLNLLPIWPLDGGRVVWAIAANSFPQWGSAIVLFVAGGGCVSYLALSGQSFWAGVAATATVMGALGAAAHERTQVPMAPVMVGALTAFYLGLTGVLVLIWLIAEMPDGKFFII